jgi:uncharacterized membrane protein
LLKYLVLTAQTALGTAFAAALLASLGAKSGGAAESGGAVRFGAAKIWTAAAFAFGIAAALTLAILKYATALIHRDLWNIGILSVSLAAGAAVLALVWLPRAKKNARRRRLAESIARAVLLASLLLYTLPELFLYPTEFVLAGESVFSTDFLFKLIGYLTGLLLAFIAGGALYRVDFQLPRKLSRPLLTAALAVNFVSHTASLVQLLYARRIIRLSRPLFNVLKQAINHSGVFLYASLLLAAVFALSLWLRNRRPKPTGANPAENRKLKAAARRHRRWSALVLTCCAASVLCLTAVRSYSEREVTLSPAEPMEIVNGEIRLSAERVGDGRLHRFAYTASDGTEVRFIVILKNAGSYGVGLDACDICGPTGYYERGDEVVCKLCDVVMNKATIGFKGGCNPVPLAYTLTDGSVVVRTESLEREKGRFK